MHKSPKKRDSEWRQKDILPQEWPRCSWTQERPFDCICWVNSWAGQWVSQPRRSMAPKFKVRFKRTQRQFCSDEVCWILGSQNILEGGCQDKLGLQFSTHLENIPQSITCKNILAGHRLKENPRQHNLDIRCHVRFGKQKFHAAVQDNRQTLQTQIHCHQHQSRKSFF